MNGEKLKKWEIKPSVGDHSAALDGMRGLAILMVVCFHTLYTNPAAGTASRLIGFIINTGWMGVPIFFVLSGFLISRPFFAKRQKKQQTWYVEGYFRRRAAKIVPPYYASIIIVSIYYFLRFANPEYLKVGLQWAVGLSNFIHPSVDMHSPYWSLLVEAHFYILLPLLFFVFGRLNSRSSSLLFFLILLFIPLIARQLSCPTHKIPKGDLAFLMFRFPCALDYFAWGVLFAGIFVEYRSAGTSLKRLGYLGYAGVLILLITVGLHVLWDIQFGITDYPQRWSLEVFHFLPGLSCFLLLFFSFDPGSFGSRVFGLFPLRFVGIVSYEWFLFHQPVVLLFRQGFPEGNGSIFLYLLKTVFPLSLTFVFSALVYRYFSLPILRWGRREAPRDSGDNSFAKFGAKPVDGLSKTETNTPPALFAARNPENGP